METTIQAIAILFILSVITEKVTQLIRQYPRRFRIIGLILSGYLTIVSVIGCFQLEWKFDEKKLNGQEALIISVVAIVCLALILAQFPSKKDKEALSRGLKPVPGTFSMLQNIEHGQEKVPKEEAWKEISVLSFIIGALISFISNANFFDIILGEKIILESKYIVSNVLLNPDYDRFNYEYVFGAILTGFFLTFGSSFFHDLLGVLFESKNLKKKLNEDPGPLDSIDKFDVFIAENRREAANTQVKAVLDQINGVYFFEINDSTDTVEVRIATGTNLPSVIPVKFVTGGKLYKVKAIDDKISTQVRLNPCDSISNKDVPDEPGSIFFPVVRRGDGKRFLVTCYHAVWHKHNWDIFLPNGHEDVACQPHGSVGRIVSAYKNARLDIALIELNNGHTLSNTIPNLVKPKAVRDPTGIDVSNKTIVKLKTNNGTITQGIVSAVNQSVNIDYPDNKSRSLGGLVLIRPKVGVPFSTGGDSGGIVVDEWDYAVGVLVAGNGKDLSFIIPVNTVLNDLNLNLDLS